MRVRLFPGLLLLGIVIASSGCAGRNLAASNAFSYACEAVHECAVYLTLTNPGREDDTLLAARTDVAVRTEFHRLRIHDQGVLVMEQVESIPVPAADVVELKPGARHIMLYDLVRDLDTGDTFSLTLSYEKGGEQTVEVLVRMEN